MELSIDSSQVQRWAEFSSDYNPIHFEVAAARALGVERPLVHGMIPMILMLHHAAARLDELAFTGHRAQLRLKRPLEIGRSAQFQCQPRAVDRSELTLSLKSDSGTHIQGTFRAHDAVLTEAPLAVHCDEWVRFQRGNFALDEALQARAARDFDHVFPGVNAPWLVVSSYAFGEFLRLATPELSAAALALLADPERERLVVVQTGYGVDVHEGRGTFDGGFERVECFTQPAALVRLEQGCSASCRIRVFRDQEPWVNVHVQLLMKMITTPDVRAHTRATIALPLLH